MFLKSHSVVVVVLTGLFLSAVGCTDGGSSADSQTDEQDHGHEHDHDHDGPATLAEALTQLKSLRDVIRDSFAANDADAAHGPLHDVGHVLEAFEELATKEKVSAENAESIKAQVETLFGAFGDVDKTMHGQEGKSWSEVDKSVDDAITALESACVNKSTGDPSDADAPTGDAEPADASTEESVKSDEKSESKPE